MSRGGDTDATESFAERLKCAVDKECDSVRDFGRRMGISSGTAHNYVCGKTVPQIDFVEAAADELGVPAEWLAFGKWTDEEHIPPDAINRACTAVRNALRD